ncbi:MAG TPA: M20/M25/M40 family metallo-hydrolase [Solirubrobacteraceae bacterium]|jgi:acetylornithine deacetylase/succinyl-diaminopimelate desuccinylase-like protein|nr:M20/M25/M40 family metallo-hydrolase [Solirubrobacteraceae bacterium]
MSEFQAETTEVLQTLIRFNTVNPPGNERPAIEFLETYLREAGFFTEVLGTEESRPNLIATLDSGEAGPVMVYLGHVDTVLAEPEDWTFDPWSGEVSGNFLWGRGALDMKSQVAAEAVAAASLARQGWRPTRGALKLVFVADEETGGDLGARWLTEQHPDKVRCDYLINEGGGEVFEYGGQRRYGVCCGEKGKFRFQLTARGAAGHASMPRTGDNALLKLGPVLSRLAASQPGIDLTEASSALLEGLGEDPADPLGSLRRIGEENPALTVMLEPMLGVTLTPTMAHASDKINVIPARAELQLDCRVPPGLGEDLALARLEEVLGETAEGVDIKFTDKTVGNVSTPHSRLMEAIQGWVEKQDPEASTVPVLLPGFSDSMWFRKAFPDLIAYGFFPQRHQSLLESAPLVHNADERIDVRDLGFATEFYTDMARELLV